MCLWQSKRANCIHQALLSVTLAIVHTTPEYHVLVKLVYRDNAFLSIYDWMLSFLQLFLRNFSYLFFIVTWSYNSFCSLSGNSAAMCDKSAVTLLLFQLSPWCGTRPVLLEQTCSAEMEVVEIVCVAAIFGMLVSCFYYYLFNAEPKHKRPSAACWPAVDQRQWRRQLLLLFWRKPQIWGPLQARLCNHSCEASADNAQSSSLLHGRLCAWPQVIVAVALCSCFDWLWSSA